MRSVFKGFASIVLVSTITFSGHADSELSKETQDKIAALMQQAEKRHGIVGQSLAILHKGKLVYTGARGLANIEHKVPATPETVYPIFSITKLFVITTMMELVEAGKAELDAPVGRYLNDIPVSWQPITLRQLLSHVSGLPDYYQSTDLLSKLSEDEALAPILGKPFDFETGSASRYNQTNYLLIRRVIEALSGMDFVEAVNQRMINRFGLKNTVFGAEHAIVPGRASLYEPSPNGLRRQGQIDFPVYNFASAGLNSNAVDLAKWFEALLSGKIISNNLLQSIWKPQYHNNGKLALHATGWEYGNGNGITSVGHYGHIILNARHFFRDDNPEDNVTVIHLSNGRQSEYFDLVGFSSDLARLLMPGTETPVQRLKREMFELIETDQWAVALDRYNTFKNDQATRDINTAGAVNGLGYEVMLSMLGPENALPVFKLNATENPNSANVWDSLGEAYLKLGQTGLAIKSYQKALSLDPGNARIPRVLSGLNKKTQ